MLRIPESVGGVWVPSPYSLGSSPRRGDLPSRGVLHTTETDPGTWDAVRRALRFPYHALVEVADRKAYQLVELDRTASSLVAGTNFETNHAGRHCVQFSFVMRAANTPNLTAGDLQYIADLCGWASEECGIDADVWMRTHGPNEGIVLATPSSPIRMSVPFWYGFNGWCCHQHAPSPNDHWDCGALDVATIRRLIAEGGVEMLTPEFLADGWRRYNQGDPAAVEFVRASLAVVNKPQDRPGAKGERIDAAIVAFKRAHLPGDTNDATVRPAFWKALVVKVVGAELPSPAIVPDPKVAAELAEARRVIAEVRSLVT